MFACSCLAAPALYLSGLAAGLALWHLTGLFLATTLLLSAPAAILLATRKTVRITVLCLVLLSVSTIAWFARPAGPTQGGSDSLRSFSITSGSTASPWFSGIPELELVLLGGHMALTREELEETRGLDLFREFYAKRSSFPSKPSVVLDSWLFDRGHYWLSLPVSEQPVPLLLFLHGNGGNFQAYPKILAEFAQEHHVAVAMPTFGWGNWRDKGQERSISILDDVLKRHSTIDRERVFVGGISAGSIGAFHTASNHPGRFRGVIGISGAPPELTSLRRFEGMDILMVHGRNDARTPVVHARTLAAQLRDVGVEVDYFEFPDSGHFALLTDQESLLERIVTLIRGR